jgi:hypothetical protein
VGESTKEFPHSLNLALLGEAKMNLLTDKRTIGLCRHSQTKKTLIGIPATAGGCTSVPPAVFIEQPFWCGDRGFTSARASKHSVLRGYPKINTSTLQVNKRIRFPARQCFWNLPFDADIAILGDGGCNFFS